jgi:DNA repair ATPase RecN
MKAARENLSFELENLAKAKDALQYSYEKCQKIKLHEGLSYEELESFEALTSRFARLSDIIIQKVLRLLDFIDLEDTGTVRDRINRAEKKGVILSADNLVEIRILRNEIAHEYRSETAYAIFEKVLTYSPTLLESVDTITDYAQKILSPS